MKKIAITALIRGYDNLDKYYMLINRNKHIKDNFIPRLHKHHCDMVLFHEGDVSNDHQKYIIGSSEIDIKFVDVNQLRKQFTHGYWFMCQFWGKEVLDYLSDYDFVARIDDDCDIIHINEEELNYIVDNDVNYATATMIDSRMELMHRWEWHRDFLYAYCEKNNIEIKKTYEDVITTYPNFMITNIPYYRNNSTIQQFLKVIAADNITERIEMGDSVYWGMILDIIDNKGYYIIKDMQYNHHSHQKMVYGAMQEKYGGMVPDWPNDGFIYSHPYHQY